LRALAAAAVLVLAALAPAAAQDASSGELVVGTKLAPPFAIREANGDWGGISIDLWRSLASATGLKYRIVERPTAETLIDAAANHEVDVAISALTVTAARSAKVDFTASYYSTGAGVAVRSSESRIDTIIGVLLSVRFFEVISALIALAAAIGFLVWLLERKQTDHFKGGPDGLVKGIWWSATAMAQAGAAQNAPATLPGRILAMAWMIASIVTIATFTAGLTSTFTTRDLKGAVQSVNDLRALRVGAPAATSMLAFLDRERIAHKDFATVDDGLKALKAGTVDAFVYDKPLLIWQVRQEFADTLRVLDLTLDRQSYAIALPKGSALRDRLNVPLLTIVEGEDWQRSLYQYLGAADGQ
jgi:ABC-type amino acid transport substrate-binding protein